MISGLFRICHVFTRKWFSKQFKEATHTLSKSISVKKQRISPSSSKKCQNVPQQHQAIRLVERKKKSSPINQCHSTKTTHRNPQTVKRSKLTNIADLESKLGH